MNKIFLAFFIPLFVCCNSHESNNTYFGGEIVNPTDDYVVLYKNDQFIDSIKLDKNNRFLVKLKNPKSGLYNFKHNPEYQYFFINEGDSILLRLNTLDFDESLVFSGRGADKSNMLMDILLMQEDEANLIKSYYTLSEEKFSVKIDSLKAIKMAELDDFTNTHTVSDDTNMYLEAAINYPYYRYLEIYPYYHRRFQDGFQVVDVPKAYYNYQNEISYDGKELSYFRPYFDYMVVHFNNLSYLDCYNNCKLENRNVPNRRTLHRTEHKLKIIDSLVTEQTLRDHLYRNTAYDYLLHDEDKENNLKFFNIYKQYSKKRINTTKKFTSCMKTYKSFNLVMNYLRYS